MTPFPHTYRVSLTGRARGHGELRTGGVQPLPIAAPPEFGGPGDAWSPEALLLAAVESCFLFTLQAVARHARLEFDDVTVDTEGIVDRRDGVTRFTDILLRVALTVPAGTDHERARHLLEKTERTCLVSASLATPIRLETDVVERPASGLRAAS